MRVKNQWMIQVAPVPGKIPPGMSREAEENLMKPTDVVVEAFWDPEGELTLESVVDAARTMTWWKLYSGTGLKVPFMPVSDPVLIES